LRSLERCQGPEPACEEDSGDVANLHRNCFACGRSETGLGLTFVQSEKGNVSSEWFCDIKYQGYPGIVHGGVIATLLDSAMTNCLLLKGVSAVTADMHVEYHSPLKVGSWTIVKASLTRSRSPLFMLDAEVVQNEAVCATATAKFMRMDVWSDNYDVY